MCALTLQILIVDTFQEEDLQKVKDKIIDRKLVSRIKGKLVKMVKDIGDKFDDYSASPKIRQMLLHWGYELIRKKILLTQKINV